MLQCSRCFPLEHSKLFKAFYRVLSNHRNFLPFPHPMTQQITTTNRVTFSRFIILRCQIASTFDDKLSWHFRFSLLPDHEADECCARRETVQHADEVDILRTFCGGRGSSQNRSHAREVRYTNNVIWGAVTRCIMLFSSQFAWVLRRRRFSHLIKFHMAWLEIASVTLKTSPLLVPHTFSFRAIKCLFWCRFRFPFLFALTMALTTSETQNKFSCWPVKFTSSRNN